MKPIIVHAEAEAEFREALVYYEGQRAGLGSDYRREIEATFQRIRRSPSAFSPIDKQGTRRCVVKRFPYSIFYVELDQFIWVAAIAHQQRRPGYWVGRTPD